MSVRAAGMTAFAAGVLPLAVTLVTWSAHADMMPLRKVPVMASQAIAVERLGELTALWAEKGTPAGAAWPDVDVDVRMEAEGITVDLYPTHLAVEVWFDFVAGDEGEEDLLVGFPEYLPRFSEQASFATEPSDATTTIDRDDWTWFKSTMGWAQGAFPFEDLTASVDGVPVEVKEETATDMELRGEPVAVPAPPPAKSGLTALESVRSTETVWGLYGSWWTWRMSFPPQQRRRVVIRYRQGLFGPACDYNLEADAWACVALYILRSGSLWRGAIGRAELHVRLHGVSASEVSLDFVSTRVHFGPILGEGAAEARRQRERETERLRQNGGTVVRSEEELSWSREAFEPDSDIWLELRPETSSAFALQPLRDPAAEPTYRQALSERWRLADDFIRLLRWSATTQQRLPASEVTRRGSDREFVDPAATAWVLAASSEEPAARQVMERLRDATDSTDPAARSYARAALATFALPVLSNSRSAGAGILPTLWWSTLGTSEEPCAGWLPELDKQAWLIALDGEAMGLATRDADDGISPVLGPLGLCRQLGVEQERRRAISILAGAALVLAAGLGWWRRRRRRTRAV